METPPESSQNTWEPPIDRQLSAEVLEIAVSWGADFADLFLEDRTSSSLNFLGGRVVDAVSGRSSGVGIRLAYGRRSVYGYTSDFERSRLVALAQSIACADPQGSDQSRGGRQSPFTGDLSAASNQVNSSPCRISAHEVPAWRRVALFEAADRAARAYHSAISQVEISLTEATQRVLVANTAGIYAWETRPYTRIFIQVIASGRGEQQVGIQSPGGMAGYEFVLGLDVEELARDAAESAVRMLAADYCPPGRMPVVIDRGFGGVIFHEACGHLLETTFVATGTSVLADMLGEQVGHPALSAIDDGTVPGQWGSLAMDDEGMPTQRTVLIADGKLVNYLTDRLGSVKTGYPRTGSGRRQSYRFEPASRMRNTFIAPGVASLAELIGDVAYGLYAKRLGGGSVVPGTGDFNFSVREAYLIRNGRIAEPVRGATLIGNGPEILHRISRVGRDLELASGMCGSISGSIPVTVGQPPILVDEITVGGRSSH